ncbi:MAG: nucleoside-diphosphate kinase [Deltaproteobacteria bacterium RIFCSPHIGHO2_12_FULL_43_9]|nr:MAG: nucleoside-diphosphate kinase [Deltaproteobacteria bacterium RIFCSPHIGHO2_12_FULL_43_9]
MPNELTLSIIKPDAVSKKLIGTIIKRFEEEKIKIAAMRMKRLTKPEAEGFYAEHKGKPFFDSLVSFMTSGPVVLMVLQGDNVILKNRDIMGATNPANADEGTLRKLFAESIEKNAVHGSDSPKSAEREVSYFFKKEELVNL